MPVSAEKRQQPMPVSAEKRQEEFQVLYERLLKSSDVLLKSSKTMITLLDQRSIVESVRLGTIVKKIQQTLSTFDPAGDAHWPLRKIREFVLDYMRCLSTRHPHMHGEEKHMLSKLALFEAARRHVRSLITIITIITALTTLIVIIVILVILVIIVILVITVITVITLIPVITVITVIT